MTEKLSLKDFIRTIFSDGKPHTMEEILDVGHYTEADIRTAITDLKAPYSSEEPVLNIETVGHYFFVKNQSEVEARSEFTEDDEDKLLTFQPPENMANAKQLVDWIADGAGLVFGKIYPEFSIDEVDKRLSVQIILDGTPSTFTMNGRSLAVSYQKNKSVVVVDTDEDGRTLNLDIETTEDGLVQVYCYPYIFVPTSQRSEALELLNTINMHSNLSHIVLNECTDFLFPCIKASSLTTGQSITFENLCHAVLETTYQYWWALSELGEAEDTANEQEVSGCIGKITDDSINKIFVSGDGVSYDYVAVDEVEAKRWISQGISHSEFNEVFDKMSTQGGIRNAKIFCNHMEIMRFDFEDYEPLFSTQIDDFGKWLLVIEGDERGIFAEIDLNGPFTKDQISIGRHDCSFNGVMFPCITVEYHGDCGQHVETTLRSQTMYVIDPHGRVEFVRAVDDAITHETRDKLDPATASVSETSSHCALAEVA